MGSFGIIVAIMTDVVKSDKSKKIVPEHLCRRIRRQTDKSRQGLGTAHWPAACLLKPDTLFVLLVSAVMKKLLSTAQSVVPRLKRSLNVVLKSENTSWGKITSPTLATSVSVFKNTLILVSNTPPPLAFMAWTSTLSSDDLDSV